MEKNMEDLLSKAASQMNIVLSRRETALFATYHREIVRWNTTANLVSAPSVKSETDIPIKHFIDSLTPLPFLAHLDARLLDIGSGAGFPGIPLKIALPSLKVSLLESSRKKTSFLKHIIRTLHLQNTVIIHDRLESIIENDSYRGGFDVVISRATFKLPDLLRQATPLLAPGGLIVAMKGKDISAEMNALAADACSGLTCIARHEIRLPVTGDHRNILIFEKVANSPKRSK
jgi:16S rRNA (guanine527-N7)-methyltransferase